MSFTFNLKTAGSPTFLGSTVKKTGTLEFITSLYLK